MVINLYLIFSFMVRNIDSLLWQTLTSTTQLEQSVKLIFLPKKVRQLNSGYLPCAIPRFLTTLIPIDMDTIKVPF